MLWIHIRKRTTRIRLPVIVCLYRILSKRAMSRSTEITVTVDRDKPEKIAVKRKAVYSTKRHSSPPIWSLPAKLTAADTGCEIKAVQRSVIVRLQSRSFEGGWRHLSLRRATRIKLFSKAVATDSKLKMTAIINVTVGKWYSSSKFPLQNTDRFAASQKFVDFS